MRRALLVVACGLALGASWGGCKKPAPKKNKATIEHRAGIPIIPRGKVVAAKSKGERYLLEIEARLPLTQAVTFYRRQLARESWSELRVQKVQPGLWGLAARRGMFELVGRIKQSKNGVVSIGFERSVIKRADAVLPPVPKDVPILKDQIIWRGPFYEAPGGRAEIRGVSTVAAGSLTKTLVAALRRQGWTVTHTAANAQIRAVKTLTKTLTPETVKAKARSLQQRGWTVKILRDTKTLDAQRSLVYHVDAASKGARVRLVLAYAELKPARAKSTPGPTSGGDAGVPRPNPPQSANVVPLPKDLILWPTAEPVLGVKRSETMLSFSLERKCDSPKALLTEVQKILGKRGYKPLSSGAPAHAVASGISQSATLLKGKRAVVVIVNRELELCTVQLTLLRKRH